VDENKSPCKWRLSDALWDQIEPLLPKPVNTHPRGGGRKRVSYRTIMNGIFFVLRTGCQWNALNATGICSSSTAHKRFQEWVKAGVFRSFWRLGLQAYDGCQGIDWEWLSMDGAMTKAPLGGEKNRAEPNRSGQRRHQAQYAYRWARCTRSA
jgi:transposase